MFQLINCEGGTEVVISTHELKVDAQRAFRERNPHLFDKKYAQDNNMVNVGTFDMIFDVQGDFVNPYK